MIVIALSILAVVSGLLWYRTGSGKRYRLDVIALVSSGAAVMFFVDSVYSYLEEGVFAGLAVDALQLSMVLVLVAVAIWAMRLAVGKALMR